jgi:hypothetical protein
LSIPFFGLGKLAGAAPTFKRPTPKSPTSASEANTVDIKAYSEEYLQNRVVAEPKLSVGTPRDVKPIPEEEGLISPVPSVVSPVQSSDIETETSVHSKASEKSSTKSVEAKPDVPQAAPSHKTTDPVAQAPPNPTLTDTKKKSKFVVKKFGFGKK